ncbi:hypothetical protein ZHAS_00012717 [Anopheles sinensis]|uniref:Uncharacterized protein n=1 Tax=Anopheles sinensis TaxID=74873 RepID=A0A084W3L4_ANOSI|nr:hypothetical protein ZHAS_00012717 [Anopheles sinensis]
MEIGSASSSPSSVPYVARCNGQGHSIGTESTRSDRTEPNEKTQRSTKDFNDASGDEPAT